MAGHSFLSMLFGVCLKSTIAVYPFEPMQPLLIRGAAELMLVGAVMFMIHK
jgi:hypothetical protein